MARRAGRRAPRRSRADGRGRRSADDHLPLIEPSREHCFGAFSDGFRRTSRRSGDQGGPASGRLAGLEMTILQPSGTPTTTPNPVDMEAFELVRASRIQRRLRCELANLEPCHRGPWFRGSFLAPRPAAVPARSLSTTPKPRELRGADPSAGRVAEAPWRRSVSRPLLPRPSWLRSRHGLAGARPARPKRYAPALAGRRYSTCG
jgi:hypothetical protein